MSERTISKSQPVLTSLVTIPKQSRFDHRLTLETFIIDLQPGGNLIGVPVNLDVSAIDLFGASINGSIWEWRDGRFVTITTLEPGNGYWVNNPSGGTIPIAGPSAARESFTLDRGWNQISPTSDAILNRSVDPSVRSIWTWDSDQQSLNRVVGNTVSFDKGKPYWIYSTSDAAVLTLNPITSAREGTAVTQPLPVVRQLIAPALPTTLHS